MKKIITSVSLLAVASVFLVGCGDENAIGKNQVKTKQYYKAHYDEAEKRDAFCKEKLKTITNAEKYKYFIKDCKNANEAVLWGPGFKLKPPVHGNANDRL